jgi:transposase
VDAAAQVALVAPQGTAAPSMEGSLTGQPEQAQTQDQVTVSGATIQPKDKKQLASDRVQNPHEPQATYSVKGQGENKKEHVGYKVQVAETVCEVELAPGEPTRNFIAGMLTHPAYQSDEAGAQQMEQEQARMGLDKPPVQYVDGAYVSAQKLAQTQAEGRELIGPAQSSPRKVGQFTAEDFQVRVEDRQATCPAGKTSTQCSRLEEASTGKISYRFEWSTHCHDCPLRGQCLGKDQRPRTLVVGEHHTVLQARRTEQQTHAFKQRLKHRNGIEGTQSELVRGHGLRQAR